MNKKSFLKFMTLGLVVASAGALAGCGGIMGPEEEPNTLLVRLYNAGWGKEWIDGAISRWEAKNPDYKVKLDATYTVTDTIKKNILSSKNPDDVYISTFSGWKNWAAAGKLAPLDDLMEEEVDGVKVKDKVNDEWQETLYFQGKTEKHVYRLPWTSGMGGIYYNKKMFEANGWAVPTTTDELLALVETIKEAELPSPHDDTVPVKPFTFSLVNTDYFDYAVYTWWMQLNGAEATKEFFKYDDPNLFDNSIEGSPYQNLQKATEVWRQLFGNSDNYTSQSLSNSNHESQKELYRGEAAMCFNGDWLYNETLKYGNAESMKDTFELAIMKAPVITGAKETNIAYSIGSDQYIAIPATSKKQDLAKSFIKELITNDTLTEFTNKSHGFLGYKNSKPEGIDRTNVYVDSYLKVLDATPNRFSDISNAKIYLDGTILNPWIKNINRPFERLLLNNDMTVQKIFDDLTKAAKMAFADYQK